MKEFGAAVEASLFFCRFNDEPGTQCIEKKQEKIFGWVQDHFVSDVVKYIACQHFDGLCPFEWRQGLKHDCSMVMELERQNGHFLNGDQKIVNLENDLVYGILKSSELKGGVVDNPKKFTIVTQKKIGQDTSYIRDFFPLTFDYLEANKEKFFGRKSSIYKNKPPFSIFGIGDYSFLPYKVAISGLYKSPTFTLVLPHIDKPIMLDDTCYFIGFNSLNDALLVFALLRHSIVKDLLGAITFQDAKRIYTKDVLMRIDLIQVSKAVPYNEIQVILKEVGCLQQLPNQEDYINFCNSMRNKNFQSAQMQLF